MTLTRTRTFTQTHRHFIDASNVISVEKARSHELPLLAECGEVWIPGTAREVKKLPMCPTCDAKNSRRYRPRRDISEEPHYVYRLYDDDARLIYVGCTVNPVMRMEQHRKNSWWFDQVASQRLLVFPGRNYALVRETEAIVSENPRWNRRGKWSNRLAWSEDDYRDYYTTLVKSGSSQTRHMEKVADEALRRFGAELAA